MWPENLQLLPARQKGGQKKKRVEEYNQKNNDDESVDALVLMGTHCKAGEDVRSCSHTNADHTVDPAEKPLVTVGLEMKIQFIYIY